MTLSTAPTERAREEAAAWFTRLKKRDVPAADMRAFQLWRRTPGNKEAYDEVDALWRRSETLKSDPDIAAILAKTLAKPAAPKPRLPQGRLGYALALIVILVLGAGGYAVLGPKTYATGVGEQRTVQLADGSTLILDTDSKVTVSLGRHRRDLRLQRGQALFDVAHDATRPFVVTAGDTSVTALGTRFDVRRDGVGATVTLVRGAVEVREGNGAGPAKVWRLAPGQRVATRAPASVPQPVDVDTATSWTTGRLIFRSVPLRDAVAEFNRYERRPIEVADGPVGDELITGVFAAGDAETFVGALADLHDLTVVRAGKDGPIRLTRAGDGDRTP